MRSDKGCTVVQTQEKKENDRIAKIVYVVVDQWVGHGRDGLIL